MKRLLYIILVLSMLFGVVACQQTPESPIVIGKNQDEMLELAQPNEASGTVGVPLSERYDIPAQLTHNTQSEDGRLVINIDAQVIVPEENRLPIARVVPADFTQEQATRYFQAFCADKEMLVPPSAATKSDVKRSIDYMQGILTDPEQFAGSLYDEEDRPGLEEELAALHRQYATMPEEPEWTPCDGKLGQKQEFYERQLLYTYLGLEAATKEYQYTFSIVNNNDLKEAKEFLDETGSGFVATIMKNARLTYFDNTQSQSFEIDPEYRCIDDMRDVPEKAQGKLNMTPQQAHALAEEHLPGTDMTVQSIGLAVNTEQQAQYGAPPAYAYIATIVRSIEGVPCAGFGGSARPNEGHEAYAPDWTNESFTIMMDDRGIFQLHWASPYEVTEILQEDAQILPFEKVGALIENMLPIIYAPRNDTLRVHTISIHTVSLELMRIIEHNSVESGLMVPVWNLYGESVQDFEDNEGNAHQMRNSQKPLLTINAIDGSIIDIDRGY